MNVAVSDLLPMKPVPATASDADSVAGLYAKAFRNTGFNEFCAQEKRDQLVGWVRDLCGKEKLWIIADAEGPVTLGHYEPDKGEIITIATRDGMERTGYGTAMLKGLMARYPGLMLRPVTPGGKALARSCGFLPTDGDSSLWIHTVV